MTFCFHLGKEECHLKLTGVCSLNRWFYKETPENSGDADFYHCRKILKSLKKDGQLSLIDVGQCRCGHYLINDGQHRLCIAKRKALKLKAVIEDCNFCIGVERMDIELR